MASRATASRKPKDPAGANPADASKLAGLDRLRAQIDAINVKLVRLLNQRAKVAQAIGHLKQAGGAAIYQPARERAVLDRVTAAQCGSADGRASAAHLRRDNLGLHRARASAARRLPRPRVHLLARGSADAFRLQRRVRAAALDRGGIRGARHRARRFRRGAGREFNRGIGDADARPVDRHAAGDHRRDAAADSPCADVARGRRRGDTRDLFPSAVARPVPQLSARPTFRIAELEAVASNALAARARGGRARRRCDRLGGGGGAVRAQAWSREISRTRRRTPRASW